MNQYLFSEPRKTDALKGGIVRCYYNEVVSEVPEEITNPENNETTTQTRTEYAYNAVDIPAPVTKGALVDAILRAGTPETPGYSQADVEAIFRHKIAKSEGSAAEFTAFNNFAEWCKAEATRILSE